MEGGDNTSTDKKERQIGDIVHCQDCGEQLFLKEGEGTDPKIEQSFVDLSKTLLAKEEDFLAPSLSSKSGDSDMSTKKLQGERIQDVIRGNDLLNDPICIKCLDSIILQMQAKIEVAEGLKETYMSCEYQIQTELDTTVDEAKREEQLLAEEKQLIEEYKLLELQESKYEKDIEDLWKQSEELDVEEKVYWNKVNDFESELINYEEENARISNSLSNIQKEYSRLSNTNVFNDVFNISFAESFGTINGFRIGRLSTEPIQNEEINAGLGQVILLLCALSKRFGYTFEIYELHPQGNYSKISQKSSARCEYELWLPSNTFNDALCALLQCLDELCQFVEQQFILKEDNMPKIFKYEVVDEKIGLQSVRFSSSVGKYETWTKAMKYFLSNCKWLIAVSALKDKKDFQNCGNN